MNSRRNFFKTLAVGLAGFAILPNATTYARKWHKVESGIYVINPDWVNAKYELTFYHTAPGSINVSLLDRMSPKFLDNKFGSLIFDNFPVRTNNPDPSIAESIPPFKLV